MTKEKGSLNTKASDAIVLTNFGLLFFFFAFLITVKNFETIQWCFVDHSNYLRTNGIVTKSSIGHTGVYGGWNFYIEYEYYIDGDKYLSDRVHFGYQGLSDSSYAQEYVNKYPVGKHILVYYNPDDRYQAVLEPDVKWPGMLYFLVGLALSSVISFMAGSHLRNA